jgi:hypothetical protein
MTTKVLLTHHHRDAIENAADRGFWMPLPLEADQLKDVMYLTLLPEELTPFGRHGERAVVQITAEVAEGIADAAPIVEGELRLRLCHGLILLGSLACH